MNKFTLNEWIIFGKTGISSKTFWAALSIPNVNFAEYDKSKFDYPYDDGDFGRCYSLVKDCGLNDQDLIKIKTVFKWLEPLIDNWDKFCKLYEEKKYDEFREELGKIRPIMSKLQGREEYSIGKGITLKF